MADKLDWMNKHVVLLRYVSLKDVMEKEGYKIQPDMEEFFRGISGTEEMVFKFADIQNYKCACELLSYISRRRASVWWGCRCILSPVSAFWAYGNLMPTGEQTVPALPGLAANGLCHVLLFCIRKVPARWKPGNGAMA